MTNIVPRNSSLAKIKNENDLPGHISLEQFHQLLDQVEIHRNGRPKLKIRDKLLLEMLMQCGGRISDILDIQIGDLVPQQIFDGSEVMNRYVLNLRVRKTRIINGIPLSNELMMLVFEHCQTNSIPITDKSAKLFDISRKQAWSIVRDYGIMAGIKVRHRNKETKEWEMVNLHPHHLRHSSAVNMMRQGVPMPIISAILGHSSIGTTMSTYMHVSLEAKDEWMKRVKW